MILDSSMVEHSAVNRRVVGSSPTRGARNTIGRRRGKASNGVFLNQWQQIRLHGQAVKTPPFHGGNRGSNPLGVIWLCKNVTEGKAQWLSWLERRPVTAEVGGSSPPWVVLFCESYESSEKTTIFM